MSSNNSNNNYRQHTIILNSTNYVSGSGNRFEYQFPTQMQFIDAEIALVKCNIYNCVYNISSDIGNNTFSIKWIDGSEYNFTIRDGYYSISDLNYFIQNAQITSNLYTNTTGSSSVTVYINLDIDSTGYGSVCTTSVLPTASQALASSITKPTNAQWNFSSSSKCPQIKFNALLSDLLGLTNYSNQFIPSNNVTVDDISTFSNTAPNVSVIDTYLVGCSMINNSLSQHPQVFHSIPLGASSFGEMIIENSPYPIWNPIINGTYKSFYITFFDQAFKNINLLDKEITLQLLIKYKL